MTAALLSLHHISKTYRTASGTHDVFRDFSLDVFAGEFVCIIGPSGCGKTTLLKMIGGFDRDYDGSIIENGSLVIKPSPHRIMVFQDQNQLFPWKTVLENVLFPLKISGVKHEEARKMALEAIDMNGLSGNVDYYPHELSGGMKQRAALARALVLKPSILLMDEPFSSLDQPTRMGLQNLLIELHKATGVTILFVTHDEMEADRLSTRKIRLPNL